MAPRSGSTVPRSQPPAVRATSLGSKTLAGVCSISMQDRSLMKLGIGVLLLILTVANSGVVSLCASCCVTPGSPRQLTVNARRPMDSGKRCGHCPASQGFRALNPEVRCTAYSPIATLQEGAFSYDLPRQSASIYAVGQSAPMLTIFPAAGRATSSVGSSPPSTDPSVAVSLRI